MADLAESSVWEDGIYQLETTDPVVGGASGISNRQAKELANRTVYLKDELEDMGDDLAAHVAAGNPHAQYAPIASPALTGTPTAPTASGGTNTTQLSTTAFVQAAITALIAGAPANLNTLDELAAALGDDPSFATTISAALAAKASLSVAQTFTKAQRGAIVTLADGANITPDFSLANFFSVVLGGNRTFTLPANLVPGQSGIIWIQQDGAGSRQAAWAVEYAFVDGIVPILTPSPNAIDALAYAVKASNHISCVFLPDLRR